MQPEFLSHGPKPTPAIWYWYVALCVLLALGNIALIVFGFWFMANEPLIARESQAPQGTFQMYGMLYVTFGFVFGVGNLILPFIPKKPWAYVLHLTNIIAAGLTCCLAPMAIPVFIYWLKPDAKELFDFR